LKAGSAGTTKQRNTSSFTPREYERYEKARQAAYNRVVQRWPALKQKNSKDYANGTQAAIAQMEREQKAGQFKDLWRSEQQCARLQHSRIQRTGKALTPCVFYDCA
jgi:hypothetical protein